jgi:replicative DNA helicase
MTMAPFEQLPPHDLEAEEAVIAAGMLPEHPDLIAQMAVFVSPSDFFREKNGWIWGAILSLFHRGETANQITVAHELAARDRLEEAGGQTYLSDVIRRLPTSLGAEFYAKIVRDAARRREVIRTTHTVSSLAYEGASDADTIIDNAQEAFVKLGAQRVRQLTYSATEVMLGSPDEPGVVERIAAVLDEPEKLEGYRFGWQELEDILGGLVPTHFVVLMGDTSVGKSFVADNIAWQLGRRGIGTWVVSTEMDRTEVFTRITAMEAGVNLRSFRNGSELPTTGLRQRLTEAESRVGDMPISVCDVGRVQLKTIEAEARRVVAKGVQVIILDHLQDIRVAGFRGAEQMEEVASGAKAMAMLNRVPVIAVSHISRDAAKNGLDLHSGKWGSAIEQYANDLILLEPVFHDLDGWSVLSETAADSQRAKGWIFVRARTAKMREGAKGYSVRALSWNHGGRLVQPNEVMA